MLSYIDHVLHMEGVPLPRLISKTGTPCFLISEARLRSNCATLKRGLSCKGVPAAIRYCCKTNNEAGVLKIIADCGCDLMASHPAEVRLAMACGFNPSQISYQRPVLLEHEVETVVRSGVKLIHAYRQEDLDTIDRVAAGLGTEVMISLRIRNDSPSLRFSPLGFLSRRLGFQKSGIESAVERVLRSRHLQPYALNFYCGTQRKSSGNFRNLMRVVARICRETKQRFGINFREVNFGGGIPSPSLNHLRLPKFRDRFDAAAEVSEPGHSLERFVRALAEQFVEESMAEGIHPLPALAVEPGRSIVGNAGVLLTRVEALEKTWAFLDASRNYLGESVLLFRRGIFPVVQTGTNKQKYYHFSGNTLNTTDVLDFRRRLPELTVGDVLCFADAGAYTISRAGRYAGLNPAVYMLEADGAMRLIRRPEDISDLTAAMCVAQDREAMPSEW
jgi:diaminopimelate decarboxylase